MYPQLEEAIDQYFADIREKIILVKNERFAEYGSGFSLYRGLEMALKLDFDELVFAEGDLYVDAESFRKVCSYKGNVITCNSNQIIACESVAFYQDSNHAVRFVYDTAHRYLEIKEPFTSIYNSGQVWKFAEAGLLRKVFHGMAMKEWTGTNLAFVEKYFRSAGMENCEIIQFKNWINCNTVEDFMRMQGAMESENFE